MYVTEICKLSIKDMVNLRIWLSPTSEDVDTVRLGKVCIVFILLNVKAY